MSTTGRALLAIENSENSLWFSWPQGPKAPKARKVRAGLWAFCVCIAGFFCGFRWEGKSMV